MILLDTNVLSELMRREPAPAVLQWIDQQRRYDLCVSAVTRAEIELGIALVPSGRRKQALQAAAAQMFAEFSGRCLAFDERAAVFYAEVVAKRVQMGRPISVEDAQIAAMALASRSALATRDTQDFAGIEGLSLVDPFTT
jgi:predicted nucleic acid-binding protein